MAPILSALIVLLAAVADAEPPTIWWETVPGVVTSDGSESFTLEVFTPEPVCEIRLDYIMPGILCPSPGRTVLLDDGTFPDLVAGDEIYTAGPFICDPAVPTKPHYLDDAGSPSGLEHRVLGKVLILDANQEVRNFLIDPSVGVISPSTYRPTVYTHSASTAITSHMVNIVRDIPTSQKLLRGATPHQDTLIQAIRRSTTDVFDFLILFSSYHEEILPAINQKNFTAGAFTKINQQRLKGIIALDVHNRGIYSGNLAHELLHYWAYCLDPDSPLTYPGNEYNPRSSVGSLLGGQHWSLVDGSYVLDCTIGRNGAYVAAPLDLYTMGLLSADQVPDILIYDEELPLPLYRCNTSVSPVNIITMQDVIRDYGEKPAYGSNCLRLCFVVESRGRLLNATEFAYYHTLAKHASADVSGFPYVAFNWAPITNFFTGAITVVTDMPTGDLNQDGAVDHHDIRMLIDCHTGPAIRYPPLPDNCELSPNSQGFSAADLDLDGDIDHTDFGILQRLLSK